jgi:5-methylcytosine-specific restriction enzyme B
MNYWHMQLHPAKFQNWKRDDIIQILKKQLIGCSGEPENTFKNIRIGDLILIRHGGNVIALVQALEMPREIMTEEQDNHIWFDVGLKINVLEYYEKLNISGKGWYLPKTLMPIDDDNDIACDFISNLYENFKNKTKMSNLTNLLTFKHQIILQGAPGTGKTYTAKELAYSFVFGENLSSEPSERKKQLADLEKSEQFKFIQFHPAYSYEDFVRGIVAESNGSQIEYKTKDKILAEFAKIALNNWKLSKEPKQRIAEDIWIKETVYAFKEYLAEEIENNEEHLMLTRKAYISRVEDEHIRYTANSWSQDGRVPLIDVIKMYLMDIKKGKEIYNSPEFTASTRHNYSYPFAILGLLREYITKNNLTFSESIVQTTPEIKEKNYVLIIDEINRANLPSVLGELIYALEYRGESVDSMYNIDGDRSLVLPENLYIIGTMNTADRSVGHIDYAIRRRFAFVDVGADETVIGLPKAKALFNEVRAIFKEHIASDFELKDIELGHSYYLAKNESELPMKLEYEIKPLLREYVKDGILLSEAKDKIEGLNV